MVCPWDTRTRSRPSPGKKFYQQSTNIQLIAIVKTTFLKNKNKLIFEKYYLKLKNFTQKRRDRVGIICEVPLV